MEPEWTTRALVDKGFTQHYDYALQTMKDLPRAPTGGFSMR